jgi:uncharacterized protein (DUF302 family)
MTSIRRLLVWMLAAGAAAFTGCAGMSGPPATGSGPLGLVALKSPHSQAETLSRLEAQVRQRNLNVVARIDHAAAAQRIGQTLRPTEVMIFGNPNSGTPLMQCAQTVGIDLPMKALVWTDGAGQVWLGWNDPAWLITRHGGAECPAAENVRKALAAIGDATVAR